MVCDGRQLDEISYKGWLVFSQPLRLLVDGFVVAKVGTAPGGRLSGWKLTRQNSSYGRSALRSRCGHYIFVRFLSFFLLFSSPNLSGRRVDVYHTSSHDVALVRI